MLESKLEMVIIRLMFLLKVQCVDSILIELSVLRNEARSQRKEAISYLASSYIVGDKCVLEHYLFDSGTVHPVAEPKVHLQHRTNCPSQVEVNRDHRAAQTHFPDKTQKLQSATDTKVHHHHPVSQPRGSILQTKETGNNAYQSFLLHTGSPLKWCQDISGIGNLTRTGNNNTTEKRKLTLKIVF